MAVLLLSTYDMGRQPFGLASPAAWLREAGVEVTCIDLSRERLPEDAVRAADLVGFFLPMHTATRLAVPVIDRVRALNPRARVCAYGLYAPLNAQLLREHGVTEVLGGEFEADLLEMSTARSERLPPSSKRWRTAVPVAEAGQPRGTVADAGLEPVPAAIADAGLTPRAPGIPRLAFRVPDRAGLPEPARYAMLQVGDDRRRTGYTEASRGCKHRCRHCPIVPVYDGRFRIVPVDVVIADVRNQLAAGAQHITFGDPDFFNGIGHATAVLQAFGREFPGTSYDVTIKVEHLLRHAGLLPLLSATGCAFVTSAVESIDDGVLLKLEKGHTAADFERVVGMCRAAGLTLSPTFVAFTPWTTIDGYCEMLDTIDRLALVDHVAQIQLGIRLLITESSRLLELEDVRRLVGTFDPRSLTYPWRHPDARVDALQAEIMNLVGDHPDAIRRDVFARVWRLSQDAAGRSTLPRSTDVLPRAAVPYLNEPWYC